MNNRTSFSVNRVIRGVVIGLPPTFFVLLHLHMIPKWRLPLQPSAGSATSTKCSVGSLPQAIPLP
jgi:hypothetical protein